MASVKVEITSRGNASRFIDRLTARLKSGSVDVGFLVGATYPMKASGKAATVVLPVAQVVAMNEFGTSRAPARPFMRNTVAAKSGTWGETAAQLAKNPDLKSDQILGLIGETMKDDFVTAIVQWPADNAPSTVDKKGFNHGLIERGIMQRAVDYVVRK